MNAFCQIEQLKQAYFVTKRDEDFGVTTMGEASTAILRIPAHIFCYLLGQAERVPWTKSKVD